MTQKEMQVEYELRQKWFTDRIGKVVYRNKTTCPCTVCADVYKNGLAVQDMGHAKYLQDIESDFTAEGHITQYFDTIKERDEFELEQIKTDKP